MKNYYTNEIKYHFCAIIPGHPAGREDQLDLQARAQAPRDARSHLHLEEVPWSGQGSRLRADYWWLASRRLDPTQHARAASKAINRVVTSRPSDPTLSFLLSLLVSFLSTSPFLILLTPLSFPFFLTTKVQNALFPSYQGPTSLTFLFYQGPSSFLLTKSQNALCFLQVQNVLLFLLALSFLEIKIVLRGV